MRLIKLHIKPTDYNAVKNKAASNDWSTNVRVSTEIMELALKEEFNLEISKSRFGRQIVKSPYSYSYYIAVNEIGNSDNYYQIRISNHLCNGFSKENICNIITDDFNFLLNTVHKKEIRELMSNVKKERLLLTFKYENGART